MRFSLIYTENSSWLSSVLSVRSMVYLGTLTYFCNFYIRVQMSFHACYAFGLIACSKVIYEVILAFVVVMRHA